MGYQVDGTEVIEYQNQRVVPVSSVYAVLNKPDGYICSRGDSWGRKTVYELLPDHLRGLFTIGRLDLHSEGLIILTNDGDFAQKHFHPSSETVKKYHVFSSDKIPERMSADFRGGIDINGVRYRALKITRIDDYQVEIELVEGKKREIREVFKYYGLAVRRLIRTGIGRMSLSQTRLEPGQYRLMTRETLLELINGK
jgi:23S rRNA pseudouridine2605 synthase